MVDWIEEPRPVEALVHRDLEERLLKSMHVSYDQVAAPVSNSALECVWLRRPGAALLAFAVVTLLTACSRTELKRDNQIYKAYGDTWVYFDSDGRGTADPWGTLVATLDGVSPSGVTASDWIFR